MEALFQPDGDDEGGGRYDVLKVWELQLAMKLTAGDEEAYGLIPVTSRARYICAEHLSDWVSALDMREMRREHANASQSNTSGESTNGVQKGWSGQGNFSEGFREAEV